MAELASALDNGGTSRRLTPQLLSLAVDLRAASSRDEAYSRVARAALHLVSGCAHSTITVSDRGRPSVAAASDPTALAFELLQQEVGEGPSLAALASDKPMAVGDLEVERRWGPFTRRAVAESPVRAVLSQPLVVGERTVGVLNLYACRPDAFDPCGHEAGRLLAGYAAIALANVEEIGQLREALESRDVISTAKGILMGRQDLSEEQAFDVLRRASRRSNVKVKELARTIVARNAAGSAKPSAGC